MKTKYYIELDLEGFDITGFEDRYNWLGATSLVAEGDTLEELLEDAHIFTSDQDGGSGPDFTLGDAPRELEVLAERLLREEFARVQIPIVLGGGGE